MICVLNGEEIELPEDLVENEDLFKSVVSIETWNTLSEDEKAHLLKYIPTQPSGGDEEHSEESFKLKSVELALSTDENFKYGNPTQQAYEILKDGLLSPSVHKMKMKCKKLKYKNYKLNQKEYYKNLLQEIILLRQVMLDKAYQHGPGYKFSKRKSSLEFQFPASERVQKKYDKIRRDVGIECGDEHTSSDEEAVSNSFNVNTSKYHLPTKLHADVDPTSRHFSLFQNDGITVDDFHRMMNKHKRKRLLCEDHPDIDTTNISLADVIMRCNSMKKTGKFKGNKLNKKKKNKLRKFTTLKNGRPQVQAQSSSVADDNPMNENLEKKKKDSTKKSVGHGYPKMGSFFSLLGYFFEQEREKKCSIVKLEEKVASWQSHKSSELSGWKTLYSSWVPLVKYAIEYMTGRGTASSLHEFIPLLLPDDGAHWTWTGPEHHNDEVILPLCHHWFETLSQAMKVGTIMDKDKKTIDTAKTTYIVRKSTDEEKDVFRRQEKARYENPHCAYIYKTHGYESIVGPVKGVFSSKDITSSKAREHAMLVSDRPAFVTILCLVRDAVARLPNGEGTRAEVCTLLKDSQFLNPQATDSQIHAVVSGALDRLHAEKDPCVRFDAIRKVWIYLHRVRSVEKFEKLHEASAAAALAKKQMSMCKQKSAKQKRTPTELSDQPKDKDAKPQKKENPIKSKKTKNTKVESTPHKNMETTPTSTENQKKSATKRKRSVNDSGTTKLPKLSDFPIPTEPAVELQLSLENEALMATQSILSDEESSDIFSASNTHSELIDMNAFNNTPDEIPNFSMDPAFEMTDISSFSNAGDRLGQSIVSPAQLTGLRRLPSTNVDSVMPTNNSAISDGATKNAYNRTTSLSDVRSNHSEQFSSSLMTIGQRRQSLPDVASANMAISIPASLLSARTSSMIQSDQSQTPYFSNSQSLNKSLSQQQQVNSQQLLLQQRLLQQHLQQQQQKQLLHQKTNQPNMLAMQQSFTKPQNNSTLRNTPQQLHQGQDGMKHKTNQSKQTGANARRSQPTGRTTQPSGNMHPVRPQIGISIGNAHGTTLQTLSQFITSKVKPISTAMASIPDSSPIVMNRKQSIQSPYQIQQLPQKVYPKTVVSPGDRGIQVQFQNLVGAKGVTGFPFIDIKGSRGNQMIASRPPMLVSSGNQVISACSPAAVANAPKINVSQKTTLGKTSPAQTFSLNQIMAVTRNRAPEMISTKNNIKIPQIGRTSNPILSPTLQNVVSMQKPGIVSMRKPVNTHLVIQRQVSSGGDQSVAKMVQLSKTMSQDRAHPVSPQTSTMPFQKIETGGNVISGGNIIPGGSIMPSQLQAQYQQINKPIVAPLKISLPRSNFSPGVLSPVRLASSPGLTPVRLSAPKMSLPSTSSFQASLLPPRQPPPL